MTDLLSASIDTIVKTFNDEMITFLNQLMVIADQIEISKVNLSKVQFSKRTLVQAININSIICINLFVISNFILNIIIVILSILSSIYQLNRRINLLKLIKKR